MPTITPLKTSKECFDTLTKFIREESTHPEESTEEETSYIEDGKG